MFRYLANNMFTKWQAAINVTAEPVISYHLKGTSFKKEAKIDQPSKA
jgi:hypothetical protein